MTDRGMSRRRCVAAVGAAGLAGASCAAGGTSPRPVAWAADRVFDGQEVLADHAVVLAEGAVVDVLPRHRVPPALPLMYEPGTTILPGLIDAHVHHMQ